MKIISPTGILGYGFDRAALREAAAGAEMIGCDAGSTDFGPYHLGSGAAACPDDAVESDLSELFDVAQELGIPLVIGSCGGAGTNQQVDELFSILKRKIGASGKTVRVARVYCELDIGLAVAAMERGLLKALDGVPEATEERLRSCSHIVALHGPDPIGEALMLGAEIVLSGRCSDAAIFAGFGNAKDPALAWSAGKLLECGAACADPPGSDPICVEILDDELEISAVGTRRCTVDSVKLMLLHENKSPFWHEEFDGFLDLSGIALAERTPGVVTLSGASFVPKRTKTVRVEGATLVGYRRVLVGGISDRRLVEIIPEYLATARIELQRRAGQLGIASGEYSVHHHVYGLGAVLGRLRNELVAEEVGLVVDIVANSEVHALLLARVLKTILLHSDFAGRLCSEGNLALPFSPADLDGGPVYEFSVWHSMEVEDWHEIAQIQVDDVM